MAEEKSFRLEIIGNKSLITVLNGNPIIQRYALHTIILGSVPRDVLKIANRFPKSEFPLKTQAIPFNITTTLWIVDSIAPSSYVISAVCSTLWRNYIARPLFSPSKFERPPEETQQDAHQNPRNFTFLSMLHLVPLFIQVNGGCDGDFLLLHTSRHRYPLGRRIYAYTVRGIDWDKDLQSRGKKWSSVTQRFIKHCRFLDYRELWIMW